MAWGGIRAVSCPKAGACAGRPIRYEIAFDQLGQHALAGQCVGDIQPRKFNLPRGKNL